MEESKGAELHISSRNPLQPPLSGVVPLTDSPAQAPQLLRSHRFLLEELRNFLVLTRNFLLKAAKKTFPQISIPLSISRFQSVGVMEG